MNIGKIALCTAAIAMFCMNTAAWAKLPPPTPQQQALAKQTGAKKAAAAAKEKQELAAVQDKIAARYKARKSAGKAPVTTSAPATTATTLPAAGASADSDKIK